MPRYSKRRTAIRALEATLAARDAAAMERFFLGEEDSLEDELDDHVRAQLANIKSTRYYARATTYRKREDRWHRLLHDTVYLNDREFLEHFRVSRPAFHRLVSLIEDNDAMRAGPRRTFRGPVELHLMVLLKYLGTNGNDNTASKFALFFGFGKGSTTNYVNRAVRAILKLTDTVITWPDADERKEIAARIQDKFQFPNCVGLTDGTLLPLETKPESNGEKYYTRKGGYAVHALITCDDLARIRHVVVGWPGSVHDDRVMSNTDLNMEPRKFFSPSQYLLGDSVFQASPHMVPAYKKPSKAAMPEHKSYFNTKLAKIRIKSEHSIGLIKARFPFFKAIRVALNDEDDMRHIIEFFLCACIFTNLLVGEPIPSEWDDDDNTAPNSSQTNALDEEDELNMEIPTEAHGGERREQLLTYLLELRG